MLFIDEFLSGENNSYYMKNNLPIHLGGHFNVCHIDQGIIEFAIKKFKIKSFLDIGCGTGGMIEKSIENNLNSFGIDGDFSIARNDILIDKILIHDYTKGISNLNKKFDMVWSCEFLEHVEEKYIENYMPDFKLGKHIFITFAPVGKSGHHHVNCKSENYWIDKFEKHGFMFDLLSTLSARKESTMHRDFFRKQGLVFLNKN